MPLTGRLAAPTLPDGEDRTMPEQICFVIAPIGDEGSEVRKRSDRVFTYVIEPAVKQCGYQAVRADKILKPGIITDQVIQQVITAPMAVADLTGHNANAFYELAVRHMVKKPLVQMITKGEKIPFDVAASRVLHYDEPDLETVEKTRADLVAHIRSAESGADNVDNPISVSVNLQALRASGDPLQAQLAELTTAVTTALASIRSDVADLKTAVRFPQGVRITPGTGALRFAEGLGLADLAGAIQSPPITLRSQDKGSTQRDEEKR